MQNPYQAIVDLLNSHGVSFETIEHEPVFTSDQAATVRGITTEAGAKSLLLNTDGSFVLCILPGSKKLDTKKVKKLIRVKNLRFATPEEVLDVMGCEVGACYPFGNLKERLQHYNSSQNKDHNYRLRLLRKKTLRVDSRHDVGDHTEG